MKRRSLTLQNLLLALLLASPAGAVEKGAPEIPSLPSAAAGIQAPNVALPSSLGITGPVALISVPDAAIPTQNAHSLQAAVPGAQPVADVAKAVAPQLAEIAKPAATGEASAASGENVTTILQGGKAQASQASGSVDASGATSASGPSGLSAPSAPAGNGGSSVPPAPKSPKEEVAAYHAARAKLKSIAMSFGMVFTLPQASARVEAYALKQAAGRTAVFSDIDDTLGGYNKVGAVLSPEMAADIVAVRKAGKMFAAITDRPDVPRPNSSQKGAFQSFEPIAAKDREGIILATNGGGKIYQYDAAGEPKLIFEEPALEPEVKAKVDEAAEVIKAGLSAHNTALEADSPGPYGRSIILKGGTPESTVKALAAEFQAELAKRGLEFEVEGRMAKDPSLPPYITFSKLNKALAVAHIAKIKGITADKAVALGDSMYKPVDPKPEGAEAAAARAEGERLSGGAMPLTGNATDANMEKGLPGMLMLSVGGTADSRMANGYVMQGKGPDSTARALRAIAKGPEQGPIGAVLAVLLVMLMTIGFYAAVAYNYGAWVQEAERQAQMQGGHDISELFR